MNNNSFNQEFQDEQKEYENAAIIYLLAKNAVLTIQHLP